MRLGPPPGKVSRPFWLLALLIGSGTLGMHVFAPVLPMISSEFAADPGVTQLTISLYMFALAGGQIVYGPLSDRFGRRNVLMAGIGLYMVAGVLAALSTSLEWLLAARVLQASGGCAGLVLGRAIVHDTSRDADAASTIGALNTLLLISPALAPVLGLWIADIYGWRSVPLMLVAFGAAAMFGIVFFLSETSERLAEPVRAIAGKYGRLLTSPLFVAYVFGGSLTTTTMFTVLTTSPFVVTHNLGRPLTETGYFYVVFVGGLIAGNIVAARLVRAIGFGNLILFGAALGTVGGALFLASLLGGWLNVPVFLVAGFLYTSMAGVMAPLTLTRSVGLTPQLKGSASGIYGFSQMMAGAVAVSVAGAGSDVALTAAIVMVLCAGTGLVVFVALALRGWGETG